VTLNKFEDDTDEDIKYIKEYVESQNVLFEVNEAYLKGGEGCIDLANKVLSIIESKNINYIYNLEDDLKTKIDSYAKKICNASNVIYTVEVLEKINKLNKYKYPICVAKTQMSISDDKKVLGAPLGYDFHISDVEVMNGAKFIVVYSGKITTMSGLSDDPGAKHFKVLDDEIIFPN
jgi:formate--tetrahydrofolate ligase